MIRNKIIPLFLAFVFCIFAANLYSQTRIAVLPFQNMEGQLSLNVWCYNLQDSLVKALLALDPEGKHYNIVPLDSIEAILAELNIDPVNPQYPSDMWLVVKRLNVQKVVTGNFNIQAQRFLINAYVYNPKTRLFDRQNQAIDIFKQEQHIYEAIPVIVESIKGALIK